MDTFSAEVAEGIGSDGAKRFYCLHALVFCCEQARIR
ncbi:hypothetical protein J2X14_000187 [Pantoea alhagi]|nr:hypothetical protein [Pantoea alhagi]